MASPSALPVPNGELFRYIMADGMAAVPLTDPEQIGMYCFLVHRGLPRPACVLYLLDEQRRLLSRLPLISGRPRPMEEVRARVADALKGEAVAAYILSMTVRDPTHPYSTDDLIEGSSFAFDARRDRLPLAEIVLIGEADYLPLYRYYQKTPEADVLSGETRTTERKQT